MGMTSSVTATTSSPNVVLMTFRCPMVCSMHDPNAYLLAPRLDIASLLGSVRFLKGRRASLVPKGDCRRTSIVGRNQEWGEIRRVLRFQLWLRRYRDEERVIAYRQMSRY